MPDREARHLTVGPDGPAISRGTRISARDDASDTLHAHAYIVGSDPEEWPIQAAPHFEYVGTYPFRRDTLKQVQGIGFGVTGDGPCWYVSRNDPATVYRIPIANDLRTFSVDDPGVAGREWSPPAQFVGIENYDHFGALSFHGGELYVPMERYSNDRPGILMRVDPHTLQITSYREVHPSQGTSAPWCAVNPVDGFLYSSSFLGPDDRVFLTKYDSGTLLSAGDPIELYDEQGAPSPFRGIQGGAFSANGHLYLATSEPNALVMVDMVARRRFSEMLLPGLSDEFEGVVIVDLDTVAAPCSTEEWYACRQARLRGQIHVIDKVDTTRFTFHHWEVAEAEKYKI